jgi:hypothetical protein
LGFGVGVALACRVGVADGALDVPGLLLAAGAAAGVAVHAVARQTTAPATNINRMRDSIGTRCDGTVKGLAAAMPARADRRATPFAFDPRARLGAPRAFPPWAAASRRLSSSISDPVQVSFPPYTTVEDQAADQPIVRQNFDRSVPAQSGYRVQFAPVWTALTAI